MHDNGERHDDGQPDGNERRDDGRRVIAGRYVLLDALGSGGMGTVWRATDELLQRTVAVKEVRLNSSGEELDKRLRRAHHEARALARVSHPHVVNVYDLVDHEDRIWLMMELVDGSSLAEVITSGGPLPPHRVAEIGLQLLAALDAVHAADVLHRDIKPGNVLLRHDGSAVLCDFGIAALAGTESLTAPGGVIGSLEFIAPERLTEQPAGAASDLFSLGGTLCALLSGRPPFPRTSAAALLHAVMRDEPELPEPAGPLHPLLTALLRKDPAERPSAAEAMDMLRRVAPTSPKPMPMPGPHSAHGPGPGTAASGTFTLAPGAGSASDPGAASGFGDAPDFGAASGFGAAPDFGAAPGTGSTAPNRGHTPNGRRRMRRRVLVPVLLTLLLAATAGTVTAVNLLTGDDGKSGSAAPTGKPSPKPSSSGPEAHSPAARVDSVMPLPDSPDAAWLFSGDRYLRVAVAADGADPFPQRLAPAGRLANWTGTFRDLPSFRERIDAVLPIPGSQTEQADEYYVFSGRQYVRIRVTDGDYADEVVAGPAPLSDWDGAFARFPGFEDGIDAIMPAPDDREQFWVFSGEQYVRFTLDGEGPGGEDELEPVPLTHWGTFAAYEDFSRGIDAALRVPGAPNDYWVFSGDRYLRMRVPDETYDDEVVQRPAPLRDWGDIPE